MRRVRPWALGLVPAAVFYVAFFFVPQFSFLRLSLYEGAGITKTGVGPTTSNFGDVLSSSFFYRAVLRTLQLSATAAVLTTIIAFALAFVVARSRRYGGVVFIIAVASMFSSAVALTLGWQSLLADTGVINRFLLWVGVIGQPLNLAHNYTAVVIGTVHIVTPLAVLTLAPICEAIPGTTIEAARGLGASRWRTFWYVVFPQTRSGVIGTALLVFAVVAGTFVTPALLGGGRVALLPLVIREQMLVLFNFSAAATLSVILIAIIAVVVVATLALTGRRRTTVGRF